MTPVILFDGMCNLCDRAVRFLIGRDRKHRLRFATLQSALGARLAAGAGVESDTLDTLILLESGRAYVRSTAVLRALGHVAGPWRFAAALRIAPRPLRDWVYAIVAGRRYRWFGRRESCRVPSAEERERFLE